MGFFSSVMMSVIACSRAVGSCDPKKEASVADRFCFRTLHRQLRNRCVDLCRTVIRLQVGEVVLVNVRRAVSRSLYGHLAGVVLSFADQRQCGSESAVDHEAPDYGSVTPLGARHYSECADPTPDGLIRGVPDFRR